MFTWNGRHLYRVTPWPFPHKCIAGQARGCVYTDNSGRRRVSTFKTTLIGSLPNGVINEAVTVPGGLSLLVRTRDAGGEPYAIVALWTQPTRKTPIVRAQLLPVPAGTVLRTCGAYRLIYASWPVIHVPACSDDPTGPTVRAGFWETSDGGQRWAFIPAGAA